MPIQYFLEILEFLSGNAIYCSKDEKQMTSREKFLMRRYNFSTRCVTNGIYIYTHFRDIAPIKIH